MRHFNSETSERVNEVVREFLESQLGESPSHVSSNMHTDILTTYAFGVVSPAEEILMGAGNQKFCIEYKVKQFDSVKNLLLNELKKIIDLPVRQIFTTVSEDGIRIIHVCFKR